MNQGVLLMANDISNWNGDWLLMNEWSLASLGSATFTNVTLKQYFVSMFNTMNVMHSRWTFGPRGNGQGAWCFRDFMRGCIVNPKL